MRHFFIALAVGAALLLAAVPVRADLAEVNIFDNTVYEQTSGSAPTSPSFFFFNAGGNFSNPGDFTSATLTDPTNTVTNLPVSGTSFGFGSSLFTSLSDLHNTYPFGTYTITGNGGTAGPQSETFSYLADAFPTDVPALAAGSFTGLQGMNVADPFTVNFNAFTPNANLGFTFFSILEGGVTVFTEGFLSNSTTSVVIPANTLLPGTAYSFELDFSDRNRSIDPNTGITVDQGFDLRTDGGFTSGTPAVPEPASVVLFGTATAALVFIRRRVRN